MGLRRRAPPPRRPLPASSVILRTLDDSPAKLFIVSLLTSALAVRFQQACCDGLKWTAGFAQWSAVTLRPDSPG